MSLDFDALLKGPAITQYGVKGMRWGVRKDRSGSDSGPVEVSVKSTRKGQVVTAKGGGNRQPAKEAVDAAISKQKAKASGVAVLTNQELQALTQRMNLEQQYSKLTEKEAKGSKAKKKGSDLIEKELTEFGKKRLKGLVERTAGAALDAQIKKHLA